MGGSTLKDFSISALALLCGAIKTCMIVYLRAAWCEVFSPLRARKKEPLLAGKGEKETRQELLSPTSHAWA